ncbi:MAG: hypothetical protein VB092_06205 [Oscillospiraceae bacterium]|nr:hypothetical protein [Oscillospiraceae bacterium]
MAKGFLYGSSGGAGMNLAFKAYATEAAMSVDTPAENTIGIVTTTAIGKVAIKATQPTTISGAAVAEGDVWILNGAGSSGAAQISKKNGVEVWCYPLFCKQYISGAWAVKTAKSYIDGAWVTPVLYLYKDGDKCVAATGGYNFSGLYSEASGSYTVGRTSGDGAFNAYAYTTDLIDVTNFETLYVYCAQDGNGAAGTNEYRRFGFSSTQTPNNFAAYLQLDRNSAVASAWRTLDVSALTGSYYFVAQAYQYEGGSRYSYMTVYETYLD